MLHKTSFIKRGIFIILTFQIIVGYGQEQMEMEGSLIISNANSQIIKTGTIRWTGGDFEGWNGVKWITLSGHPLDSIQDIDGNVYKTKRIGDQFWMIENLRVTKLNDGLPILRLAMNADWLATTEAAYCWFRNDSVMYATKRGALYNQFSAWTNKICPLGWKVPADEDWDELANFLGGAGVAGGKMKERETKNWEEPNFGASNISGFTSTPTGYRSHVGGFENKDFTSGYWQSNIGPNNSPLTRNLTSSIEFLNRINWSAVIRGFAIRCVKQ